MDSSKLISKLEIQIFKYKVFKREAILVSSILTVIMLYLFYLNGWQNKFVFISIIISTIILSFSFYKVYANRYNEKVKFRKEIKRHYNLDTLIEIQQEGSKSPEGLLSKKLDGLLKDAKIDNELMQSLGKSIRDLEYSNKKNNNVTESEKSSKKYSKEMSLAAAQMESLDSLYKVQLENVDRQSKINQETIENAAKLKEQMEVLASNLSTLSLASKMKSKFELFYIQSFLDYVKSESLANKTTNIEYDNLTKFFEVFKKERLE